ncbi:hypothetical protein BVRB_1g020610 [Beta vulgaris subsp. vulgaris]|uniref:Uncharacterized protein n=1 Tax=Beta vulgaris subsp. vulgaris TaxID=3555 RepID=A0A0J8BI47_BETVV|nr:hypothetical protein BVRB_1g020610 [Beta vulgaris subsp. vulgaris]
MIQRKEIKIKGVSTSAHESSEEQGTKELRGKGFDASRNNGGAPMSSSRGGEAAQASGATRATANKNNKRSKEERKKREKAGNYSSGNYRAAVVRRGSGEAIESCSDVRRASKLR